MKHELDFIVDHYHVMRAVCSCHKWERIVGGSKSDDIEQEPLELTSYHHWMHQLEELRKEEQHT